MSTKTKAYNSDWECVYDSESDPRTLGEFFDDSGRADVRVTVDEDDHRWSGIMYKNSQGDSEVFNATEYFRHLTTWSNPLLDDLES